MKTLITACLILFFASFSFAGDVVLLPTISTPEPGKMDIYVVTNDKGHTDTIAVVGFEDGSAVAVDNHGNSTYITKLD